MTAGIRISLSTYYLRYIEKTNEDLEKFIMRVKQKMEDPVNVKCQKRQC